MSKNIDIVNALAAAAATTGIPVVIDRRLPVSQDDDFPLVVVRTGEMSNVPIGGSAAQQAQTRFRRWNTRPSVEVYLDGSDDAALRAEYDRVWMQVLAGIDAGALPGLIAQDTIIDAQCSVIEPGSASDIGIVLMEFGFIFDR